MRSLSWTWTIIVLCGLFTAQGTAQFFELTELPMETVLKINDSGAVIGVSGSTGYLWENNVSIGLSSFAPGGINIRKQLAGTMSVSAETTHVFIWLDYTLTDLGSLGGRTCDARAINDSTEVAGYSWTTDITQGVHAFFWKNGVMSDLGTLGGPGSSAWGMNNAGQVVGISDLDDTTRHAFLWQSGTMSDLGTLGGTSSIAAAINNGGQIVGTSTLVGPNQPTACLWSSGGISNLGYLIDDSIWSTSDALGINDAGEVVGTSSHIILPYSTAHAFFWKNGTMVDLNEISDTSGGWELNAATGINNRGDIVCNGFRNGQRQAALLKRGDIVVTRPHQGDLWIGATREEIRWLAGKNKLLNISYTLDERAASPVWIPVASNVPSDSGKYAWKIPDGVNTHFGAIKIVDASDSSIRGLSRRFRMRTWEMVRLNPDSSYTRFQFGRDSWSFANVGEVMWPEAWYNQFSYNEGFTFDPFLNKAYPMESPFDSARFSDFPDWPLFVRAFGQDYAYQLRLGLDRDYNLIATAKWKAIKGTWGGSCSGLSLSSILGFDNRQAIAARYSAFPAGGDLFSVPIDDSLRLVVNELFQGWEGKQHQVYLENAWPMGPRGTIEALRESFLDEANDHRYLYISWIEPGGSSAAHAIVPYKLERDTLDPGWYTVHVYDVSYPGSLFETVIIDSVGNRAFAPRWTPSPLTGVLLMDPSSTYLQPPTPGAQPRLPVPTASPDAMFPDLELWPVRNAYVRIDKSTGGFIEYAKGVLIDSLRFSPYFIPPTASPSPPALYMLHQGSYRVKLHGFADQRAGLSLFGYEWSYSYERFDADSAQVDAVDYNNGLAVGNPDAVAKTITLESIGDLGGGHMRYRLQGLIFSAGDTVSIAQRDGGAILLENGGTPKITDIFVKRASYYKGSASFRHAAFAIPGNAELLIRPANDSITALKVLIDNGRDGTFDDSTLVGNELTGVGAVQVGTVPSSFALHQNYPNPFNPSTTIGYELPVRSHVTLKVFDVLGREVATLVDGMEEAGHKAVSFHASSLPSGVYTYTIAAGTYRETMKMLLIR
jgi:probable HAF family extracellular repeat protein